jgi:hypothetical protein
MVKPTLHTYQRIKTINNDADSKRLVNNAKSGTDRREVDIPGAG